MPKVITISKKEAANTFCNEAPEGFRFAIADDFHINGIRKELVVIYILQWGKSCKLVEHWFNSQTSRNWLQWLLYEERVFIKVGDRYGCEQRLSYFIIPTNEYIN